MIVIVVYFKHFSLQNLHKQMYVCKLVNKNRARFRRVEQEEGYLLLE